MAKAIPQFKVGDVVTDDNGKSFAQVTTVNYQDSLDTDYSIIEFELESIDGHQSGIIYAKDFRLATKAEAQKFMKAKQKFQKAQEKNQNNVKEFAFPTAKSVAKAQKAGGSKPKFRKGEFVEYNGAVREVKAVVSSYRAPADYTLAETPSQPEVAVQADEIKASKMTRKQASKNFAVGDTIEWQAQHQGELLHFKGEVRDVYKNFFLRVQCQPGECLHGDWWYLDPLDPTVKAQKKTRFEELPLLAAFYPGPSYNELQISYVKVGNTSAIQADIRYGDDEGSPPCIQLAGDPTSKFAKTRFKKSILVTPVFNSVFHSE